MKKYKKTYLGKGKRKDATTSTVRITMKLKDLENLAYEFKGRQLVTVHVAEMRSPDNYGKTHIVYTSTPEKVNKFTSLQEAITEGAYNYRD